MFAPLCLVIVVLVVVLEALVMFCVRDCVVERMLTVVLTTSTVVVVCFFHVIMLHVPGITMYCLVVLCTGGYSCVPAAALLLPRVRGFVYSSCGVEMLLQLLAAGFGVQ